MSRVKDIRLQPVTSRTAIPFIKTHHYSGKVVNNSVLHVGCFLDGRLGGVMSFGPPLDRSKVIGLVRGTHRENFLELNRMAFSDILPRNSESHCIRVAMRIIGKRAPQVKWILSFADATQCGDGTIYRASGFKLTQIRGNRNTALMPWGEVVHKMTFESNPTRERSELGGHSYYEITGGRYDWKLFCERVHAKLLQGFQIRYIGFIDQSWSKPPHGLTVPELPYSAIKEAHASMYKGVRR